VINRINDILTVTRLLIIFKTYETVDEALDYLTKPSAKSRTESRPDTRPSMPGSAA